MNEAQPSILAEPAAAGLSLTFRTLPGVDLVPVLSRLRDHFSLDCGVLGIGEPVIRALGRSVPGLRTFPAYSGAACTVPSTQGALVVLLRGADRGIVFDFSQEIRDLVAEGFVPAEVVDTFTYQGGRDLTRFEDGTANPQGDQAVAAAILGAGEGLKGSSFVAVQRWVHDLKRFWSFSAAHRDALIGRRADTNEEIADAPAFAHVKRTEQESYTPPAFMLRRSMPWATANEEGLLFISYVESLDRFDVMMRRMVGLEDGIVDGLFSFSRPVSGGYYWCPPVSGGRIDLRLLGL